LNFEQTLGSNRIEPLHFSGTFMAFKYIVSLRPILHRFHKGILLHRFHKGMHRFAGSRTQLSIRSARIAMAACGNNDAVTSTEKVGRRGEWHKETTAAYKDVNILDHPAYWKALSELLLPFSSQKHVADIGCADGKLSTVLQASHCANVDPFPPEDIEPTRDVIKMDGIEYLQMLENNSLDLVTVVCAIHFMDRVTLERELERVLKPSGRAIYVGISPSSKMFGGDDFNAAFFENWTNNVAQEDKPAQQYVWERDITRDQLSSFVARRTWTNLTSMPQQKIDSLVAAIPDDVSKVSICLEVIVFSPSPPVMVKAAGA